uniref:Uncharacterized protein n=1 Tax=Kalanchoe fedtschenkoi TaxID=63787 RepID=A0A7N0VA82_KALFE
MDVRHLHVLPSGCPFAAAGFNRDRISIRLREPFMPLRMCAVRSTSLPFPEKKADYYKELEAAVDAVERACRLCADVRSSLISNDKRILEKSDQTPVTVADFGVQALISLELGKLFPSIPLVAEEDSSFLTKNKLVSTVVNVVLDKSTLGDESLSETDVLEAIDRGGKDAFVFGTSPATYWVLDPIDGTKGFLKGNDALYVVGLALVVQGEIVLGVMGCPNWQQDPSVSSTVGCGIIMMSHFGCGTWTKRLQNNLGGNTEIADLWSQCEVDGHNSVPDARFCISDSQTWDHIPLSSMFSTTTDHDNVGEEEIRLVPTCCGSLCKYLMVASGRASIFIQRNQAEKTIKAWDHAVGVICVREAGGRRYILEGMAAENNNQVSNPPDGIVSCNPAAFIAIQMALKAAIELNVFNIMAESGPLGSQLSALQIASKIPTSNPKAATSLHRILRFLSINSFLTTSLPLDSDKEEDRLFGLTPMTADMMVSKDGAALPIHGLFVLTNTEKEVFESFEKLKNFVLEPDGATCPFEMAHGVGFYDYLAQRPDSRLNILFDQSMGDSIKMFFDPIVKVYGGFSEVVELLNVGGNDGSALEYLISVYPKIEGVNFDLPHVIARAPNLKGVKHVAGDMFETLPNSKTILLKWILHNWTDEKCVKLLQNCWRALPKAGGKVIVLEMVIPHDLGKNKAAAMQTVTLDFIMLTRLGGKERTVSEFRDLALAAGFSSVNIVPTENLGIHVLFCEAPSAAPVLGASTIKDAYPAHQFRQRIYIAGQLSVSSNPNLALCSKRPIFQYLHRALRCHLGLKIHFHR